MKKILLVIALLATCFVSSLSAQQITKFAVVDTDRVYKVFYRNSQTIRDYESKKSAYQTQINKMTQELQNLKNSKTQASMDGNTEEANKLQEEINQKAQNLREYTANKNAELNRLKANLETGDAFYKKLYRIIGNVAEREGFCMVLSPQQNNAILWYSDSVDITDKVIAELKK